MTRNITIRPGESVKTEILRIAESLTGAVRRPGRSFAEDVHRLRTTTKRLRALLRLIRPAISTSVFEREDARLKQAAQRLAPLRDQTAASDALRALGFAKTMLQPARRSKIEASDHAGLRDSAGDLKHTLRGFQRMRIAGDNGEAIEAGFLKTYRQARRRMKTALADPRDETFHRWRIRVKQLYYQLEWLEPAWPKRFGRMKKLLHRLEEKLGTAHDLAVLHDLLESMPQTSDAVVSVKMAAGHRSRRLQRAAKRLGKAALDEGCRAFRRKFRRHLRMWQAR